MSPEYKAACEEIKQHAGGLLKMRRFAQLNIILGIFSDKVTGKQGGDDALKQHAASILNAVGNDYAWDLFLNLAMVRVIWTTSRVWVRRVR